MILVQGPRSLPLTTGGSITVYSLVDPITEVSVSSDNATLTARVDRASRKIYVADYSTGTDPSDTLSYTLANVVSGLSAERSDNTVTV